MVRLRLFTAVQPPAEVTRELEALRDRLAAITGDSMRWVQAGNLHVTVHFIGDTPRDAIDDIAAAMAHGAALAASPIPVVVEGVGAFPNARRPRTVWAGVADPEGRLSALERHMRRALAEVGVRLEERAYHPHITLGYVRKRLSSVGFADVRTAIQAEQVGPLGFVAREVELVSSVLGAGGARHSTITAVALGDASDRL